MSLTGRQSDYIYASYGEPWRCDCCHSKFKLTSDHAFKRLANGRKRFFCSWNCMNKWDHDQADRDREIIRSDSGMKMSLQSWASLYDVNYYDFWKKVMIEKIKPKDAVMILRI